MNSRPRIAILQTTIGATGFGAPGRTTGKMGMLPGDLTNDVCEVTD